MRHIVNLALGKRNCVLFVCLCWVLPSLSLSLSLSFRHPQFTAEEPLADVTSHRPLDQSSVEGGGGGGGGMRESDSLVRLRTESEMSGEVSSTGSKSPNQGVGEEGGGGGGQPDVEDTQGVSEDAEDTLRVWSHLLKNWEENVRKSVKQVRQRAREGIPGVLRGMAWQLMCGAQDHNLRDRYPALLTVSVLCVLLCVCVFRNPYFCQLIAIFHHLSPHSSVC